MALSQTRLLSPLPIKGFTVHNDMASFQKKLEDIIEWFVLHRGKTCTGLLGTAVVLFACSYLWRTIDSLGQTPLIGVGLTRWTTDSLRHSHNHHAGQ